MVFCLQILQLAMSVNLTPKKDKQNNANLPSVKISPVKVPNEAKQIGNYILGKTIGSGTYGKVHLGLHIPTGERVAVKVIQKVKLHPKDLQRIHRQIQILKKVMHPSLVQLYQIIQTQKSLLFVTEYMPNGELFNYIIKRKKLPQEEANKIFNQIIEGVRYMHEVGIAHRDLKPENILIDYDGKVKIIDFGLSNTYKKNQKLKTQCGSPCYAAPEMIQGKAKYDPLMIDIWSSGVVLYAMLAGYLPFCDPDTSKLYKKILAGSFKFPTWISDDAKDLIEKMLTLNPNKRATLDQIMQHPWYKKDSKKRILGIDTRYYLVPYEPLIIKNIQKLGLNLPNLTQFIEHNHKNKETALYYLIAKKIVKDGHIVSSFVGCQNFSEELLKPIHFHAEDDNIQSSTHIDVQAVDPIALDEEDISTPETNSGVQLYRYKQAAFQKILDDFMSTPKENEDLKIVVVRKQFYANNLENKKKKQCLKIKEEAVTVMETRQQKKLSLMQVYRRPIIMCSSNKKDIRLPQIHQASKLIQTLETASTCVRPRRKLTSWKNVSTLSSQQQTRSIV